MSRVFGVVLALLAVGLAVVPMFTDCHSQGKQITLENGKQVDMKCHWAGIAEIGVAVSMFLVGGFIHRRQRRGCSQQQSQQCRHQVLLTLLIVHPNCLVWATATGCPASTASSAL